MRQPKRNNKQSKQSTSTNSQIYGLFRDSLQSDTTAAKIVRLNRGIDITPASEGALCPTRRSVRVAYTAVEDRFDEAELECSGLHERDGPGLLRRCPAVLRAMVLFFVLFRGKIQQIRPHKRTLRNQSPLAFGWHAIAEQTRTAYLVEGEFKAMVLHQMGYSALSTPGISALVGNHFSRFAEMLKESGVEKLIVLFDNPDHESETLTDGRLNTRYKDKPSNRYSEPVNAVRLGRRLEDVFIDVEYVRLPDRLRRDGEADIDSVYTSHGKEALRAQLTPPSGERAFLRLHPPEAEEEIRRRLQYDKLRFTGYQRARVDSVGSCLYLSMPAPRGTAKQRIHARCRTGALQVLDDEAIVDNSAARRKLERSIRLHCPSLDITQLIAQFRAEVKSRNDKKNQEALEAMSLGQDPHYETVNGLKVYASRTDIYTWEKMEDRPVRRTLSKRRIRFERSIRVAGDKWYEISVGGVAGTCRISHGDLNTPAALKSLREHAGARLDVKIKPLSDILIALYHIDAPEEERFPGHLGWDPETGNYNMPSVIVCRNGEIVARVGPYFITNVSEDGEPRDVRELRRNGDKRPIALADFELPPAEDEATGELVVGFAEAMVKAFGIPMTVLMHGAVALAAAVRLPGGKHVDIRDGMVHAALWLTGQSGTGKSKLCESAACCFGFPAPVVEGSSSITALNDQGDKLRDVLLVWDDASRNKTPNFNKAAAELIQRHGDHADRPRGTQSGGTRVARLVQGLLAVNSEDDLPGSESHNARAIVFEHESEQGTAKDYVDMRSAMEHGPKIGALIVSFIRSTFTADELRSVLQELKRGWVLRLGTAENRERVAEGLAQFEFAGRLWCCFVAKHGQPWVAVGWAVRFAQYLQGIASSQVARVANQSVGMSFLEKLYALHASAGDVFQSNDDVKEHTSRDDLGKVCVVSAGKELWIIPDVALQRLQYETGWKPTLNRKAIARELANRGLLTRASGEEARFTHQKSIRGKRTRVWVLDEVAVEERRGR